MIQNDPMETPWQFTIVYGPPTLIHRHEFLENLVTIDQGFNGPWCIIGDFNMVINVVDKKGVRVVASSSNSGLGRLVD